VGILVCRQPKESAVGRAAGPWAGLAMGCGVRDLTWQSSRGPPAAFGLTAFLGACFVGRVLPICDVARPD